VFAIVIVCGALMVVTVWLPNAIDPGAWLPVWACAHAVQDSASARKARAVRTWPRSFMRIDESTDGPRHGRALLLTVERNLRLGQEMLAHDRPAASPL